MKKHLLMALGCIIFSMISANSHAVNFTLQFGVGSGGDKFISSGQDEDLAAGDVLHYGGAVDFDLNESSFLRVGFALREGDATFADAEEEFSTKQLDALYLHSINNVFLFGGGITFHQAPEYKIHFPDFGVTFTQEFDNAMGFVGQVGLLLNNLELGLRLDMIEYEAQEFVFVDNATTEVNSFTAYMAYRFK